MLVSDGVGKILICNVSGNKFLWILPNCFASSDPDGRNKEITSSVVNSPRFSAVDTEWCLALVRFAGLRYDTCGLFIWQKPSSYTETSLNVKLGLLDTDHVRQRIGKLNSNGCFGDWDFIQLSDFNRCRKTLSADGLLRFFCEMSFKESDSPDRLIVEGAQGEAIPEVEDEEAENSSNEPQKEELPEERGVARLVNDFAHLLLNELGSDVVLKNGDHEFRAHMAILGARSPVFASMFQHDMIEKKTGEVDIADCSTTGFKVFLQFLYSGNADISSENVIDLYYVADKYQVIDLKLNCVEFMKDKLTVDIFCDVIALSLRHSESDLQKYATRFFCNNIKEIVKTINWQKYLAENPIHANELIIKAINA